MNMNDLELPDVKALVAFGKLGLAILASRMLSMAALFGAAGLSTYTIYTSSWQGVCVTLVFYLIFMVALKAETKKSTDEVTK